MNITSNFAHAAIVGIHQQPHPDVPALHATCCFVASGAFGGTWGKAHDLWVAGLSMPPKTPSGPVQTPASILFAFGGVAAAEGSSQRLGGWQQWRCQGKLVRRQNVDKFRRYGMPRSGVRMRCGLVRSDQARSDQINHAPTCRYGGVVGEQSWAKKHYHTTTLPHYHTPTATS